VSETPTAAEKILGAAPGDRLGRYVLEKRLGSGGMGDVWKAHDTSLDRAVAIKVLKSPGDEEIARFRREAHVAARLSHPNIAAVYEVGEERGRHFIAMQLIDGRTLKDVSRRDRRALVEFVRDAARALDFAHATGIVHRDVKPENVMVAADGHVYVMDFGLARHRAGLGLTATGVVMGTPPYMAPEQAHGREVDRRADVFALGATLYELLTGRKAFEGDSDLSTLRRVCEDDPRPPRSIDGTIDADLQTVVMKCLEKEPLARYPRAGTLADDLDRWLAGEPIAARPLGAGARLARWAARHRALVGAAAAVALVVVTAALALAVQQVRASRREAADRALAAMWSRIVERKRELRLAKTSPQGAREGLAATVREVDALVRARPDDPRGWYVRARGRLYLDDLAGATADAREAIARDPSFRAAWTLIGMARVEEAHRHLQGEPDHARAGVILREASDAFARGGPGGGVPWTREDDVMERTAAALRLWYAEDAKDDARASLAEAVRTYRAEEYAFWLGIWADGEERRRWLAQAVEWAPGWAEARWNLGAALGAVGDSKAAVEQYDRAIEARPELAFAWYNRGLEKGRLGDGPGAVVDFTRAVELRPDLAEAWIARGNARIALDDPRGAAADYERALAVRPSAAAFCSRGGARERLGDPAGALADYGAALELDAAHVAARRQRMMLRYGTGDWRGSVADASVLVERDRAMLVALRTRAEASAQLGDNATAARDVEAALALRADIPELFELRARLRHDAGDADGALADLDRAIDLRPDFAVARNNRGHLRRLRGDFPGALDDFDRAIAAAPDVYKYYVNRAIVRTHLREYSAARQDYDRALALRPGGYDALANRGLVLERLGELRAAIQDYEKTLELAPADWPERGKVRELLEDARRRLR